MIRNRSRRQLYPAIVEAITDVTPHMRRFTVAGEGLRGLSASLPAQWMKVFVPGEPGHEPEGRAYTIRRFDAATGRMNLDFVLHGDRGPASRWAGTARTGDYLQLAGPRAGYSIDPAMRHHLLIGDATSLPAIASIVEYLSPETHAAVFIEVTDAGERQDLHSPATLDLTWLYSGAEWPGTTGQLELAIQNNELPLEDCAVWIAGESLMVRSLRTYFLADRCFERKNLHAAGYWKLGSADHRERD